MTCLNAITGKDINLKSTLCVCLQLHIEDVCVGLYLRLFAPDHTDTNFYLCIPL